MQNVLKQELKNMTNEQFKVYSRACSKWQARLAKIYVLQFN